MRRSCRLLIVFLIGWTLAGTPSMVSGGENAGEDMKKVVTLMEEQNRKLSSDLRRIQREIAALRADLDKPGFRDVAAGIGYILGLFGTAAFVASRRKR